MTAKMREKPALLRIFTWKRVLLLTCFTVAIVMIIRTPIDVEKFTTRDNLNRIAAKDQWDDEIVHLFKKQLGLQGPTEKELTSCSELWPTDEEFLIVTGFPSLDDDDLESHLWLYFNLRSLVPELASTPAVRILLPSNILRVLGNVFQEVEFGDLSILNLCNEHLNVDELLKYSRVVGNVEEVSFQSVVIPRRIQMIILNKDTRRIKELSQFDYSFAPNRPAFTEDLNQKVKGYIEMVRKSDQSTEDSESSSPDKVSMNFIAVYIDEKDNFPELLERIKVGIEYHRNSADEALIVIICDEFYRYDCLTHFTHEDMVVAGFDTSLAERFAILSSCHAVVVNNGIGFLSALISNGEVALINYVRGTSNWLTSFVDKKEDWMIIDEGGLVDE